MQLEVIVDRLASGPVLGAALGIVAVLAMQSALGAIRGRAAPRAAMRGQPNAPRLHAEESAGVTAIVHAVRGVPVRTPLVRRREMAPAEQIATFLDWCRAGAFVGAIKVDDLVDLFDAWATEAGVNALSEARLYNALRDAGVRRERRVQRDQSGRVRRLESGSPVRSTTYLIDEPTEVHDLEPAERWAQARAAA